MIESVDSFDLLKIIDKKLLRIKKLFPFCSNFILLRKRQNLVGTCLKPTVDILENQPISGVEIRGVMGMASFIDDIDQVRREFKSLKGYIHFVENGIFFNQKYILRYL